MKNHLDIFFLFCSSFLLSIYFIKLYIIYKEKKRKKGKKKRTIFLLKWVKKKLCNKNFLLYKGVTGSFDNFFFFLFKLKKFCIIFFLFLIYILLV